MGALLVCPFSSILGSVHVLFQFLLCTPPLPFSLSLFPLFPLLFSFLPGAVLPAEAVCWFVLEEGVRFFVWFFFLKSSVHVLRLPYNSPPGKKEESVPGADILGKSARGLSSFSWPWLRGLRVVEA